METGVENVCGTESSFALDGSEYSYSGCNYPHNDICHYVFCDFSYRQIMGGMLLCTLNPDNPCEITRIT